MNIIKPTFFGVIAVSVLLSACGTSENIKDVKTAPALEQQSSDQPTPLMKAVAKGDLDTARQLINAGHSVNVATPQGSALSWAVGNKQINAVMYLLSIGADPNSSVEEGQTSPLMQVAGEGETQMVKLMLAAGADVNYSDTKGDTAISKAAYEGHLTTVKALLKVGADVNVTPAGQSLLMHIVRNNDLLLAQVLISAGADVNYRDSNGITALKIARESGFSDLEMLLVQSGADS